MSALEVFVRLALIGGSAGINLAGYLNVWVSGILGLVAMGATAELAVRPYGATIFDRLLLIAGSLVATFIVLGLVLNVTPWGLTIGTWNVAWALISIFVLIWRRGTRTKTIFPTRPANLISLSIAGAAIIIVGAAVLAIEGVAKSDAEPVLSLSMESSSSRDITVQIAATSVSGNYEVAASSKANKAFHYISKPFSISAGKMGETVQVEVPVKGKGTWVINLETVKGNMVVRQLIVNIGMP